MQWISVVVHTWVTFPQRGWNVFASFHMNRLTNVYIVETRCELVNVVVVRKHWLDFIVNLTLLKALLEVRIPWLFVWSHLSNSSHYGFLVLALRILELWHANQVLSKTIQSLLLLLGLSVLFVLCLLRCKRLVKVSMCRIEVAEHR